MRNKLPAKIMIAAVILCFLVPSIKTVNAKEYTIKDVHEIDEAYESIQDVLNQGWMSLTLGRFYPDKKISREEFAMILTKFNSQMSEASSIKTASFKDVTLKNKFNKYIELEKNYITYYKTKNGKYFKPKNYLTREDALVAIVKVLGYDSEDAVTNGADSEVDLDEIIEDYNKISPALENYVTIGVINELIDLVDIEDGTYLLPKENITRRELAQLLVNANDAKEYNKIEESTDASENETTDVADDEEISIDTK